MRCLFIILAITAVAVADKLPSRQGRQGRQGRRGPNNARRGGRQLDTGYGAPETGYGAPEEDLDSKATEELPSYEEEPLDTYAEEPLETYENDLEYDASDLEVKSADEAESGLDMLMKSIPGIPGEDYPIFSEAPESAFSCEGQVNGGYYADPEALCQVFHICSDDGQGGMAKYSFLCPNGTIFNQGYFICDWWFNVDCSEAEALAEAKNADIAAAREAVDAAAAEELDTAETAETGYGAPVEEEISEEIIESREATGLYNGPGASEYDSYDDY